MRRLTTSTSTWSVWEPQNATRVRHAYQDNRTIYRVSLLGAGPLPLLQADDSDCWTFGDEELLRRHDAGGWKAPSGGPGETPMLRASR